MSFYAMLKKNAKLALQGKWGTPVAITLLVAAVLGVLFGLHQAALYFFVINPATASNHMDSPLFVGSGMYGLYYLTPAEIIISSAFSLLLFLLLRPIILGGAYWYLRQVYGEGEPMGCIFRYFESIRLFGRALWYEINLTVRTALWSILFYLVPSGVLGASYYFLYYSEQEASRLAATFATMGLVFSAILFLLATLLYAAFLQRYAFATFLLCEDDKITVRGAIRTSIAYSKGYRFNLLWFRLSFIGWYLLSCLTFHILMLYVFPYYYTSTLMFQRYVVERCRMADPNHEPQQPSNPTQEFAISTEPPQEMENRSPSLEFGDLDGDDEMGPY